MGTGEQVRDPESRMGPCLCWGSVRTHPHQGAVWPGSRDRDPSVPGSPGGKGCSSQAWGLFGGPSWLQLPQLLLSQRCGPMSRGCSRGRLGPSSAHPRLLGCTHACLCSLRTRSCASWTARWRAVGEMSSTSSFLRACECAVTSPQASLQGMTLCCLPSSCPS